jgi:hypothetical protein
LDEGEVVARGFFIASRESTEAFEVMYQALNTIPKRIELAVESSFIVLARRIAVDDRLHATRTDCCDDPIGVVAGIGDKRAAAGMRNDFLCHHRVVYLPGRQRDVDRTPFGVGEDVELR